MNPSLSFLSLKKQNYLISISHQSTVPLTLIKSSHGSEFPLKAGKQPNLAQGALVTYS